MAGRGNVRPLKKEEANGEGGSVPSHNAMLTGGVGGGMFPMAAGVIILPDVEVPGFVEMPEEATGEEPCDAEVDETAAEPVAEEIPEQPGANETAAEPEDTAEMVPHVTELYVQMVPTTAEGATIPPEQELVTVEETTDDLPSTSPEAQQATASYVESDSSLEKAVPSTSGQVVVASGLVVQIEPETGEGPNNLPAPDAAVPAVAPAPPPAAEPAGDVIPDPDDEDWNVQFFRSLILALNARRDNTPLVAEAPSQGPVNGPRRTFNVVIEAETGEWTLHLHHEPSPTLPLPAPRAPVPHDDMDPYGDVQLSGLVGANPAVLYVRTREHDEALMRELEEAEALYVEPQEPPPPRSRHSNGWEHCNDMQPSAAPADDDDEEERHLFGPGWMEDLETNPNNYPDLIRPACSRNSSFNPQLYEGPDIPGCYDTPGDSNGEEPLVPPPSTQEPRERPSSPIPIRGAFREEEDDSDLDHADDAI
ncbi:uncharacterized protein LOC142986348 isoform X2 [Anticarsia gemmatalis]